MLDMVSGSDKDKLLGMKAALETLKAKTIRFSARTCPEVQQKEKPWEKGAKSVRKEGVGGNNVAAASFGEVRGMTIYKSPQRFGECRICDLYVGAQSKPSEPYEKHHSNWVIGCPIFMSL